MPTKVPMGNLISGLSCIAVVAPLVGCNNGPDLVPVSGKVIYKGRPLPFGSVMFQPEKGWPARGKIRADGSFELYTKTPGDGAMIGPNKVRIACFEAQGPTFKSNAPEETLGRSLIPERYTDFDTSQITVDVKPTGNDAVEIVLTD